MKTNVNITRKMGDFDIIQRTKDGMFNATLLLKQWNKSSGMKKEIKDFFSNKHTEEFINVLVEQEDLDKGNYPYVKSKASRGNNVGTWMHPYLFIKFSMWLNPKFEYHVIKFVYDELIKHRHLSGDYYNKLCSMMSRFKNVNYSEIGQMLNFVIFNEHQQGKRNKATPQQQEDLQQLERDMCQYIEMGFINNYAQFKEVLRKEWRKRHSKTPKVLN